MALGPTVAAQRTPFSSLSQRRALGTLAIMKVWIRSLCQRWLKSGADPEEPGPNRGMGAGPLNHKPGATARLLIIDQLINRKGLRHISLLRSSSSCCVNRHDGIGSSDTNGKSS